jgi:uncharacterized membrane protein HdeD (DUF308 family)
VLRALVSGCKRFAVLLVFVGSAAALVSLVLGLLLGDSPTRSMAVGLYLTGSFFVVAGFALGNRGPVAAKGIGAVPLLGARMLRWATPEEQEQTINESAIFVVLGLALLVLGVIADPHQRLA